MGISKYNADGYYDPTAYEGIRQADASARKLKITYPTGYMELNLDYFFPCTLDKARKVFSLIHRYSSGADKDRMLAFLHAYRSVKTNGTEIGIDQNGSKIGWLVSFVPIVPIKNHNEQ